MTRYETENAAYEVDERARTITLVRGYHPGLPHMVVGTSYAYRWLDVTDNDRLAIHWPGNHSANTGHSYTEKIRETA